MSAAGLTAALAVALVGLAVVLNHLQARLGLIEVALNEGLPPGHEIRKSGQTPPLGFDVLHAKDLLDDGLHIFVSRGCHACQRLLDDLDIRGLHVATAVHIRYVDRPRPIAAVVAKQLGASLHLEQHALAESLRVDPLPYTVALGPDSLVGHGVTSTILDVVQVAQNAGIAAAKNRSTA